MKREREIKDFWTYDEALDLFNLMLRDLTYAELNLLVLNMLNKLFLKKYEKERSRNNV